MDTLVTITGWIGAVGLLSGFLLNISNKIKTQSYLYLGLNFSCALLLAFNAYMIKSYPFLIINLFWTVVALYQMLMLSKRSKLIEQH